MATGQTPYYKETANTDVMAANGVVYRTVVTLMVALLLVQDLGQCQGQWAQTNGWGGAGVGKRMFTQQDIRRMELPQRCKVDPYVALLISRLAKLEAERLRACESYDADDTSN